MGFFLLRWQRCTSSAATSTSYSASADLYVPKGFKVDFALLVLSLAKGAGNLSYLSGAPEREGWPAGCFGDALSFSKDNVELLPHPLPVLREECA